ncbi:septum formation family protein [Mycolicibacterium mucogenicum]|uniref:septum formation family protein n=2 Tax=Mycolicibacterium mucogenicum TaxID=56689 RepID=UPI00076A69F1|nr:septum formation family protein [Mycolicibacterium mucogenicum]
MEPMLDAPPAVEQGLDTPADAPKTTTTWRQRMHGMHATGTQRALVLTALGGLLIAGVLTVIPDGSLGPTGLGFNTGRVNAGRVSDTLDHAKPGECLNWPDRSPDAVEIVDCKNEHRFEVAESLDMRTFPGSEYGPHAAPPSDARIKQISQEQCQNAARDYLGPRFDPNGKFAVSLVWSGDKAWKTKGQRRMLCGLQLLGPNSQQLAYKGKVADVDQSKVWPAGTCLGIDPATNQPIDIPVDCSAPHAMEVTGAVNLADKYHDVMPAEPDQLAYIKDDCTRATDEYLAPVQLRATTLTLIYSSIALPSWTAGSRQVSCSIGSSLGNGGWSTLVNSAKGPLLINGQSPVAPPAIPEERLNLPPIPVVEPPVDTSSQGSSSSSSSSSQGSQSGQSSQSGQNQRSQQTSQSPQGNQHMPGQTDTSNQNANGSTPGTPQQQQGNTFLNGPPPAPAPPPGAGAPLDGPPLEEAPAPPPAGPVGGGAPPGPVVPAPAP